MMFFLPRKDYLGDLMGKEIYRIAVWTLLFSMVFSKLYWRAGQILFYVFLALVLLGTAWFHVHGWDRNSGRSMARQLTLIGIPITVFWITNMVSSTLHGTNYSWKTAILGLAAFLYFTVYWGYIGLRTRKGYIKVAVPHVNVRLLVIILIFAVLYIPTLYSLFQGDSYVYYTYIRDHIGRWHFSIDDLEGFRCGYHLSYGYGLFAYPGYILAGESIIGIRLANLLIYAITIHYVYKIVRRLVAANNIRLCVLLTALFAGSPLILGLCQEISLDVVMSCFLIWLIGSILDNNRYLIFFNCFLLCFTKENAIILLAGLIFGAIVYYGMGSLRKRQPVYLRLSEIRSLSYMYFAAPVFLVLNFVLFNSGWGSVSGKSPKGTLGKLNTLQLNPGYILYKLEQMFVMNFKWIVLLVLAALLMSAALKRKKLRFSLTGTVLVSTYLFYIAFQLLYFTYPNYRYLTPAVLFFVLFTGIALNYIFGHRKVMANTCAGLMVAVTVLSAYFEVDPISNSLFRTVNSGNGSMISTAHYGALPDDPSVLVDEAHGANLENEVFRDYVQVNKEYTNFQLLAEDMLAQMNITEDTGIVLESEFHDPYWGDLGWTFMNMFGTQYPGDVYWNPVTKKLTYSNEYGIKINWIQEDQYYNNRSYKDVWYIVFPFDDAEKEKPLLLKSNPVRASIVETYGRWKLEAYKIKGQ